MPVRVHTLVITGYGTNCEVECAHAATLAGSDSVVVAHFSDLSSGRVRIADYSFLVFPGGFLDGDDLGAAQAASIRWKYARDDKGAMLIDQILTLVECGGLVLGICNGFQLLVKLGLLPALGGRYMERQVSLMHNASARFEDRWCHLAVNAKSPCVFTKGLDRLYFPVRHGEGRLVPKDTDTLEHLERENLVALRYALPSACTPTQQYPENPNASPNAIAGLSDPSGRILGLMPHPEAYTHPTNHPGWTRGEQSTPGTTLFANAVRYLREGMYV